jgi:hypothetical protein
MKDVHCSCTIQLFVTSESGLAVLSEANNVHSLRAASRHQKETSRLAKAEQIY